MKLLIAGSRSIKEFDISEYIPPTTDMIICGGANGIDRIAEEYADKHRITKLVVRPRYDLYRKAAPLKRNETMIDICDSVIIIWDGTSKGTKNVIELAQKRGKTLTVITVTY